ADPGSQDSIQLGRAIRDDHQHREVEDRSADHFHQIMRERVQPVTIFQNEQQGQGTRSVTQAVHQERLKRLFTQLTVEGTRQLVIGDLEIEQCPKQGQTWKQSWVNLGQLVLERFDLFYE